MKKSKVLDRETAIRKMRKEAIEGVVVVVVATIAFIGLGVVLAQGALKRDESLSLGFIERNGVQEVDMSVPAWAASMAYYVFVFVVLLVIFALMIYFLYSVKKTGVPFTIKNSRILTALSIMLIVLSVSPVVSLVVWPIAGMLTNSVPVSDGNVTAVGIEFTSGGFGGFSVFAVTLLLGGFLYTIARIFRYGSFLQDDDEGLI